MPYNVPAQRGAAMMRRPHRRSENRSIISGVTNFRKKRHLSGFRTLGVSIYMSASACGCRNHFLERAQCCEAIRKQRAG
jgi:hypothetical protein